MRKLTLVVACLLCTLILSSCTGSQVVAWARAHGKTITAEQGAYLAAAVNAKARCDADPHCAVDAAAREFGIPLGEFRRVIACESGFNPRAVNASSGALGLGQHLPRYWPARARAVGEDPAHWWFPRTNARTSAWLWRTSGPQNWVCY